MTHTDTKLTSLQSEKLSKIKKMFALARKAGTEAEAEAFNEKAYVLLATYGIDEVHAQQLEDGGPAPIGKMIIPLHGVYIKQQAYLADQLAKTLHCAPVWMSQQSQTIVYGADAHTMRVRLLFAELQPQMLKGSTSMRSYNAGQTRVSRRSWMEGFIFRLVQRLEELEGKAAAEVPGTGLVLLTDADRAEAALKDSHGKTRKVRPRTQYDQYAAGRGAAAGDKVRLGGNAVGGGRLALER